MQKKYIHKTPLSPDTITLIYQDAEGNLHEQPLLDINEAGTLVDPENGEAMHVIGAYITH